jgi:hypothetical protein
MDQSVRGFLRSAVLWLLLGARAWHLGWRSRRPGSRSFGPVSLLPTRRMKSLREFLQGR